MNTTFTSLLLLICVNLLGQNIQFSDPVLKKVLTSERCATHFDNPMENLIYVDQNKDGEIDKIEASQIAGIKIRSRQIVSLDDLNQFPNLLFLEVNWCPITTMNLTKLKRLRSIDVNSNLLESLYLSDLDSLNFVSCDYNTLEVLDVKGCIHLRRISCDENLLTSINLEDQALLSSFSCDNNLISKLDLSGINLLESLACRYNRITEFVCPKNCFIDFCNSHNNPVNFCPDD